MAKTEKMPQQRPHDLMHVANVIAEGGDGWRGRGERT